MPSIGQSAEPATKTEPQEAKPAFTFAETLYFHRFTKDDMHEYTPAGQADLTAWTDMVTLQRYPQVKDGEGLATTANAVLETYKANKGRVLRTTSVPRTKDKPAEHLIVVVFGQPEFLEATFARFQLHDGTGTAVIYSHRVYGRRVGDDMSAWLEKSGPATEQALMAWRDWPQPPTAK